MKYKLHSLLLSYPFKITQMIDYFSKVNFLTTLPFLSIAP